MRQESSREISEFIPLKITHFKVVVTFNFKDIIIVPFNIYTYTLSHQRHITMYMWPDLTKAGLDAHVKQIHFPPPIDRSIHGLTIDGCFTIHSSSVCFPRHTLCLTNVITMYMWPDLTKAGLDAHVRQIHFPPPIDRSIHAWANNWWLFHYPLLFGLLSPWLVSVACLAPTSARVLFKWPWC